MPTNTNIRLSLIERNSLLVVNVQDPKNAQKKSCNQIRAGAYFSLFVRHHLDIGNLAKLLQLNHVPLYTRDVYNSDKKKYIVKDSITINEDTLQAALGMECGTQLAIYLFVGGKLCNS